MPVRLSFSFHRGKSRVIRIPVYCVHGRINADSVTCHECKSSRQFNYRTKGPGYCSPLEFAVGFARLNPVPMISMALSPSASSSMAFCRARTDALTFVHANLSVRRFLIPLINPLSPIIAFLFHLFFVSADRFRSCPSVETRIWFVPRTSDSPGNTMDRHRRSPRALSRTANIELL